MSPGRTAPLAFPSANYAGRRAGGGQNIPCHKHSPPNSDLMLHAMLPVLGYFLFYIQGEGFEHLYFFIFFTPTLRAQIKHQAPVAALYNKVKNTTFEVLSKYSSSARHPPAAGRRSSLAFLPPSLPSARPYNGPRSNKETFHLIMWSKELICPRAAATLEAPRRSLALTKWE